VLAAKKALDKLYSTQASAWCQNNSLEQPVGSRSTSVPKRATTVLNSVI